MKMLNKKIEEVELRSEEMFKEEGKVGSWKVLIGRQVFHIAQFCQSILLYLASSSSLKSSNHMLIFLFHFSS